MEFTKQKERENNREGAGASTSGRPLTQSIESRHQYHDIARSHFISIQLSPNVRYSHDTACNFAHKIGGGGAAVYCVVCASDLSSL